MQRLRQEQARPILEKLHGYLQGPHATALPKSLLATAIGYALRANLALLRRYTKYEPVDAIAARRDIAVRLLEAGRYT